MKTSRLLTPLHFLFLCAAPLGAQPQTDIYLVPVLRSGSTYSLGRVENITARPGYDNQPQFLGDSTGFLFAADHGGQTDIYRYSLEGGRIEQLTNTPESEYSPTPTPDGLGFTVVLVEADSTQRLWRYSFSSDERVLLFPAIAPVGYHAWGFDQQIALFVLGDPPTLQIADTGTKQARVVADRIGRSMQKIPLQRAVSFVHFLDSGTSIDRYDVPTGNINPLTPPLEGSEDHAWMPDGTTIVMARDARIYTWEPAGKTWTPIGDFTREGVSSIARIAVSPDGKWMAFVADD